MSFKVVILSRYGDYLRACVDAIQRHEPDLGPERILVVDDGASKEAPDLPVTWIEGSKPFIFARNANLGIRAAGDDDVILLNDDAILGTPGGFSKLWHHRGNYALLSAAITGAIGNPRQKPQRERPLNAPPRGEFAMLCFVCVLMQRSTIQQIGELDERFLGYGYEDNDYCRRVLDAKLTLGVYDACIVEHTMGKTSSFRRRDDIERPTEEMLLADNRAIYQEKWGELV